MRVWTVDGGNGWAFDILCDGRLIVRLHDIEELPDDESHESIADFIVSACNSAEYRRTWMMQRPEPTQSHVDKIDDNPYHRP